MEQEIIYLVSQKDRDGNWNKLVKSQEHFWFDQKEAIDYIKNQPEWHQPCLAVFAVEITINSATKIFDGKDYLARKEAGKNP